MEESPLTHLLQVTHFFYDCILAVTGIGFLNGLFLNRDGFSLEGDGKYVHLRSAQPMLGDHLLLQRGILGFIKGAVPEMDQAVMINGERVSLPPAASASGATTAFLFHGAVASDNPSAFVKHTFKYRAPKTDYISSLQKSVASFPGLEIMNFTGFNGNRNETDPNVDSSDSMETEEDNVHAHSWHAAYMHLLDELEKLSPVLSGFENDVQKKLKDIHSILNVDMTIEESIEEFVKERNGKYGKFKLDDLSSTIGNTMDDVHLDWEDVHPGSSSNLEVLSDANTYDSMDASRDNETIDDESDLVEFGTTSNGVTEAVEGAGQESKPVSTVGEEIGPEEVQSKETAQVPDTRIIWNFEADYGTYDFDPALEIEDAIVQDQDSIADAEAPVEDPMQEVTFTNEENQENGYFNNESFPQDEVTPPDQINAESNFLTPESEFEGLEDSRYTADPEEFMMDYANKESDSLAIPCESDNNKLDSDHVVLHDEEPENALIMNADDDEQEEEDDDGQEDFVNAYTDAVHEDHTWSEITTTPDDANDEDFKMAQGLAKAAFHAELQKKLKRDRKTQTTDTKAQVENDMAMVRDYVSKKSVLTDVARAQGARESAAASDLLRKLAEKERQRKFDSIGLIDPRLVEPSKARKVKKEQPILQLKDVSEVSEVSTEEDVLVADDDHESTDDKEPSENDDTKALVQVAPEKTVSTFSLAKKRPVIIAAAALVIGRRILTLWNGWGLLL